MNQSSQGVALVGGMVVDGTGSEPRRADVLISAGSIDAILPRHDTQTTAYDAYETIDCSRKLVAPGFVDIHAHSDLSLLVYPGNESRISQGITTEVVGNCGMSPAPSAGDNSGLGTVIGPINVVPELEWSWTDVRGWLEVLESSRTATNLAAQIGHGSARFAVAGARGRPLAEEECRQLEHEIESALDEGCIGVSLGLMYAPGEGAGLDELVRVGKIAAARDATISAHMRSYSGDQLRSSVEEVLSIAEQSGARLEISHLRKTGNDGSFDDVLGLIEDSRRNIDVTADVYPYIAGHTNLIQLLPSELREQGATFLTQLCLSEPAEIAQLLQNAGYPPESIVIMKAPRSPEFSGRSASELDGDAWKELAQLLALNGCDIDVAVTNGSWADVDATLSTSWINVASDGTALSPHHTASVPHPRSWGAFPAAYRRMRKLGIPTGEIIRKMTDAPASRMGLTAQIIEKHRADLVVFDEDRFAARATYANPASPASGIDHVFVGGIPVLLHQTQTAHRPGQLIRKAK